MMTQEKYEKTEGNRILEAQETWKIFEKT